MYLRTVFFKVTAVLLGIILSLCLMECILWLFFPLPYRQPIRVPLKQDIPGLSPGIVYDRNIYGLRSLSMTKLEKENGTIRILCLGASTTDQPTQSTKDTWSGILETMLNEHYRKSDRSDGISIEVAAYGRGGDVILHRLGWVMRNLKAVDPDLIILLEGINDMCYHGGPEYSYRDIPSQMLKYGDRNILWDTFFTENYLHQKNDFLPTLRCYSQIARRMAKLARILAVRRGEKEGTIIEWHSRYLPRLHEEYEKYPYVARPSRPTDPLREFSDGLSRLLDIFKTSRIPAIVLSQPAVWHAGMTKEEKNRLWFWVMTPRGRVRADPAWLEEELRRFNERQREIAQRYGMVYFDLAAHLPRTTDIFFDDCHYTDAGNRCVAEAIFPIVRHEVDRILARRKHAD